MKKSENTPVEPSRENEALKLPTLTLTAKLTVIGNARLAVESPDAQLLK